MSPGVVKEKEWKREKKLLVEGKDLAVAAAEAATRRYLLLEEGRALAVVAGKDATARVLALEE